MRQCALYDVHVMELTAYEAAAGRDFGATL